MQLDEKQLAKMASDLTRLKQKKGITKKTVCDLIGIAPSILSQYLKWGCLPEARYKTIQSIIKQYK